MRNDERQKLQADVLNSIICSKITAALMLKTSGVTRPRGVQLSVFEPSGCSGSRCRFRHVAARRAAAVRGSASLRGHRRHFPLFVQNDQRIRTRRFPVEAGDRETEEAAGDRRTTGGHTGGHTGRSVDRLLLLVAFIKKMSVDCDLRV